MKSYFLSPISSRGDAAALLSSMMPRQRNPWLLKDASGDTIAYFMMGSSDSGAGSEAISVDISGRHYDRDADILAVLERLKEKVGGEITRAP